MCCCYEWMSLGNISEQYVGYCSVCMYACKKCGVVLWPCVCPPNCSWSIYSSMSDLALVIDNLDVVARVGKAVGGDYRCGVCNGTFVVLMRSLVPHQSVDDLITDWA